MTTGIREELLAATKIKRIKGESEEALAYRVMVSTGKKLSDKEWGQLSPEAQSWYNAAVDGYEQADDKKDIPHLPPADDEEDETETSPKEGNQAMATKKSNGKSKRPADTKPAAAGRGRKSKYEPSDKIKVLVKNPHREGTKDGASFDALKSGMTLQSAIEKGVDRNYINYAVKREYIAIG